MYVATKTHLNYRGQDSNTRNLQFTFLTHLWPWNNVKVIKPGMTMQTPGKEYNYAKFERSCINGVWEKANIKVISTEKICQLSLLNMSNHQTRWYVHDLLNILNNPIMFQLNKTRTVETVEHSCDLEIWPKTLKWMWYEQVKLHEWYHHAKLDMYHMHSVWKDGNIQVSATPDNHPAGWPTYSHFSCDSKSNYNQVGLYQKSNDNKVWLDISHVYHTPKQ